MVADGNRLGYRHLLDRFWDDAGALNIDLPTSKPVSAASFCAARQKISPLLLRHLLHQASDAFEGRFGDENRWNGLRVFGVDGSKFNLQRSDDLTQAFGKPEGAHCPQVLVSTLFDLSTKVPHDIVVARGASCERQQLMRLLDRLSPGDVVVFDRGYPSFELLCILADLKIDFVFRVPARNTFAAVDDFMDSGSRDRRITIEPPDKGPMAGYSSIGLRILSVPGPNDDPTVLLTTLKKNSFSHAQLAQLYRMRWEIEVFYKHIKSNYLGQGQFHSKSASGIEQEIHALALFVAMSRYLMAAAAEDQDVPLAKLSSKSGALGFGDYVVRLFLTIKPDDVARWLARLFQRIVRTKDPKHPERSFPRRSFRPQSKWCPSGRRGA